MNSELKLKVEARAAYLASLHIGEGHPWTETDFQHFNQASDKWDEVWERHGCAESRYRVGQARWWMSTEQN